MNILFKITLCLLFAHYFEGFCSNIDKDEITNKEKSVMKEKPNSRKANSDLSEEQIQNFMNQAQPMRNRNIVNIDQKHDIITYVK